MMSPVLSVAVPRIALELVNARFGLDYQCKPEPSEVTPSTLEGRTRLLDATGNAVRAMTWLHLRLARTPILRSD
jgi:hypothetical protein